MALLPPEPLLATNSVTVDVRTTSKGLRGDVQYVDGSGATYPAIVTQRTDFILRQEEGQAQYEAEWDVLIFSTANPGILPEQHVLIDDHGRRLIAYSPSTYREAGAWLVQCKTISPD